MEQCVYLVSAFLFSIFYAVSWTCKAMLLKGTGLRGRMKPSPAKFFPSCFDRTFSSWLDVLCSVTFLVLHRGSLASMVGFYSLHERLVWATNLTWFLRLCHFVAEANSWPKPLSVLCDFSKGGEQLHLGGPAFFLDSDGSLVISSPSGNETGEFICTATNAAGHMSRRVQLTVYGKWLMNWRQFEGSWIMKNCRCFFMHVFVSNLQLHFLIISHFSWLTPDFWKSALCEVTVRGACGPLFLHHF